MIKFAIITLANGTKRVVILEPIFVTFIPDEKTPIDQQVLRELYKQHNQSTAKIVTVKDEKQLKWECC